MKKSLFASPRALARVELFAAALLVFAPAAYASMFASGGVEAALPDGTATHTFTSGGTFTLNEEKVLRVLVVGGGGGGGAECGGGGGGGGVIEDVAYRMEAGTYVITVGAGGLGGKQGVDRGNGVERGGQGGDTIVSNVNGTVVFRAYGGGGGGGWNNRSGISGGCGGGAAATGTGGAAIDPSQGYPAGNACNNTQGLPSGGGGAGAASEDVLKIKGQDISGAGGAGVTSDISGTSDMYGAGGGGGNYNFGTSSSQASGGDGIGGFGQGNISALQANMKGRDGFGGGGGGGSNQSTYIAGDGGSGIVIFRLQNSQGAVNAPAFVFGGMRPGVDSVAVTVSVTDPGALAVNGEVDIVAQVAADDSAWDAQTGAFSGTEQTLLSGVTNGTHSARCTGLRPSHSYCMRIVVRNAGAESATGLAQFSTTALSEPRWTRNGKGGEPGLYQYVFVDSGHNDVDKVFDDDTDGLTVQIGAIVSGLATQVNTALHGRSYTDAAGNSFVAGAYVSYGYIGWMFMEAGATYNFFEFHYDGARLAIDGVDILRDTVYGNVTRASYTCAWTGWHRIQIWLTSPGGGNLGAPPNWLFSLGWNTNGVTTVTGQPGDDWNVFENSETNIFLRTQPMGRTVDISSWSIDSGLGEATFNAELGEALKPTGLFAVWGPWHGGNTTNDWKHVVPVGAGTVGTSPASATFTVADVSDLTYFRFVAIDEDELNAWSASQLVDLANPAVDIAAVEHDGDVATVSIRVDSVGTGDFSLRLLYGGNADLSGATSTNIATAGTGTYDVTFAVPAGSTVYYRAEAETTDGGSDATLISSFTTRAGSALSGTATASVSHHTVTFSGSLVTVGAGITEVTLWTGDSAESLVADPEVLTVSTINGFSWQRIFPGEPRRIYWRITCTNTTQRGSVWGDESVVRNTSTSEDGIVYTWKASVASGEWKDTNNWTTAVAGAFGYPYYLKTTAKFANGTTARIHLAGYAEPWLYLDYTDGDVTVWGDGPDSSYLYTHDTVRAATLNRSRFTLENASLDEYDNFDYTIGSAGGSDSRVVVTNGACMKLGGGCEVVFGNGTGITVAPGSSFWYGDPSVAHTNKTGKTPTRADLLFASHGETLTTEGIVSIRNVRFRTFADDANPPSVRLRGCGAQLRVPGGHFGDLAVITHDYAEFKRDNFMSNDVAIVFEPAPGGFTNTVSYVADGDTVTSRAAIYSLADDGAPFGAMELEGSTGSFVLSVDRSLISRGNGARQHLLLWKGGIDTDHVALVEGDGYTLRYTYGWPSVLDAPENEGDLPTGVWSYIKGASATYFFVQ